MRVLDLSPAISPKTGSTHHPLKLNQVLSMTSFRRSGISTFPASGLIVHERCRSGHGSASLDWPGERLPGLFSLQQAGKKRSRAPGKGCAAKSHTCRRYAAYYRFSGTTVSAPVSDFLREKAPKTVKISAVARLHAGHRCRQACRPPG